jgi:hypothetical protein
MEGLLLMTTAPHPTHDEGLAPLPACLAPTDADQAALPELRMPRAGEHVILHDEYVYWIAARLISSPNSRRPLVLWAAPLRAGTTCSGAAWDDDSLIIADPDDPCLNYDERKVLRVTVEVLLGRANATGTGTLFPRTDISPAAPRAAADPRVADWAEAALDLAAKHLDQAENPAAHLARSVFAIAAEHRITDPDLIQQTIDAAQAAIGLVLLTDYHRAGLIDRNALTDPAATATAVRAALNSHPRELRPDLAHRAAIKIAIGRVAVD